MKKLIIFIFVAVVSVVSFGCDKVHHKQSAVHVKNISIFDDGTTTSAQIKAIQEIDVQAKYCCDISSGIATLEPLYNSAFKIELENTLKQKVYFSYIYFVIKNYYGGGNDYVSPNLTISGDSFIEGSRKSDDENDDDDDTGFGTEEVETINGEGTIYSMFLPGCTLDSGVARCFPFSTDAVDRVGIKNVVVYIHAFAENGDEIVTTGVTTVSLEGYNNCGSLPCVSSPSECVASNS